MASSIKLTNKEWNTFLTDFATEVHLKNKKRVAYDAWKRLCAQTGSITAMTPIDSPNLITFVDNNSNAILIANDADGSIGQYWTEYYPTRLFDCEMSTTNTNYTASTSCSSNPFNIATDSAGNYLYIPTTGTITTSQQTNYYNTTGTLNPTAETVNNDGVKENKKMENKIINFDFGPANSDTYRMSMYGVAVKNRDGTYVAWDNTNEEMLNVDILNIKLDNMIYKMPVALKDVETGMIILHNKVPMFVVSVELDNKYLDVVDIYTGERKMILPTKSPFGFNFYTRIMPLIDFSSFGDDKPSADNPFGNMLPLLLLGDSSSVDPMMLALMCSGQASANPLMIYAFMASKGDNDNLLPLMLMMNGGKLNF